jgi:PAS domain S-box-containing protein
VGGWKERPLSQGEAYLWRERYQLLFEMNIAGIVLTTRDGAIVDCNEPVAQIFGFTSRNEMLKHSAWELYFHRDERETLVERLRSGDCPVEEVRLRPRSGAPIWLLANRCVVSFSHGQPELLQGTVIDMTAQKSAEAWVCGIGGSGTPSLGQEEGKQSNMPRVEKALLQELKILLCLNYVVQRDDLRQITKTEVQQFVRFLERMKMLMAEVEIHSLKKR